MHTYTLTYIDTEFLVIYDIFYFLSTYQLEDNNYYGLKCYWGTLHLLSETIQGTFISNLLQIINLELYTYTTSSTFRINGWRTFIKMSDIRIVI